MLVLRRIIVYKTIKRTPQKRKEEEEEEKKKVQNEGYCIGFYCIGFYCGNFRSYRPEGCVAFVKHWIW